MLKEFLGVSFARYPNVLMDVRRFGGLEFRESRSVTFGLYVAIELAAAFDNFTVELASKGSLL